MTFFDDGQINRAVDYGEALEVLAESLLSEIGMDDPPVDVFEVAALLGCTLRPSQVAGARLLGDVIEYDGRARPTRQQGMVAHELGHWALRWAGEDDSEAAANYLSGALLVPRRPLERQLGARWCLAELRDLHPNASWEMLARRIVARRDAVALIVDNGLVRARVVGERTPRRLYKVTPLERELADEAIASGAEVRHHDRVAAWPVIEGPYRRAVVVADVGAL